MATSCQTKTCHLGVYGPACLAMSWPRRATLASLAVLQMLQSRRRKIVTSAHLLDRSMYREAGFASLNPSRGRRSSGGRWRPSRPRRRPPRPSAWRRRRRRRPSRPSRRPCVHCLVPCHFSIDRSHLLRHPLTCRRRVLRFYSTILQTRLCTLDLPS